MAVLFQSGTNLTRSAKLIGVSSSKKATVSCWFKCDTGEGGTIISGGTAAVVNYFLAIYRTQGTPGAIRFLVKNSAGTTIYSATSDSTYLDDTWHHLVISVDLGANTAVWRLDGATIAITVDNAIVDANIDFDGCTVWKVGLATDGAADGNYTGSLEDLLFKAGQVVDLTDADILNDFVSDDGRTASGDLFWQNVGPNAGKKPVGYGVGAPIFNGEKADVYFSNCFQYNQGTGGAFTLASTFNAASANPYTYRHAAHYDNKERWFDSELTGFSYTRSRTFIEQREGHPKKGLRMGVDERDEHFRQERPADSLNHLLFHDREDDTEEWDR